MTETTVESAGTEVTAPADLSPQLQPATIQPEPATAPAAKPDRADKNIYAVVWRWHFYAGLLTAPILWVVTLTGALYVFRLEITEWRDRSLLWVTPGVERKSYEELKQLAIAEHGSAELEAIIVFPEPDRSVRFIAHEHEEAADSAGEHDHGEERHKAIYLDPYTGDVLGTRIEEDDFFSIVLELHRSLMLGTTGRVVTELVTGWGVLLLMTGLFLWWPRGKKNVGVWAPRMKGKLYAVLRDWHAVPGAYLMPLMLIVAFTGLFFTVVWGGAFNRTVKQAGHWAPEWFQERKSPPPTPDAKPASLDVIVPAILAHSRPGDMAPIRFATKPDQTVRSFMMQGDDKNSYRAVTVDQYTGELINISDAADQPFLYRVRLWAVSTHMGQIFGTPTQILALLSSLMLFALSFTGIWMWWKRRPAGRTGVPRRPPARSLPVWGWGVILLCALAMPVTGVSILLIAAVDFLVQRFRRTPAMQN